MTIGCIYEMIQGEPMGPGQDCEGGGWSYGPRAEDTEFEDIPITIWER